MDKQIIEERLLNLPVEIKELKMEMLAISLKGDKAELDKKNFEINALDVVNSEKRASNADGRKVEVDKILVTKPEYKECCDNLKAYRDNFRYEQINLGYLEDMLKSYHSIVQL